MFWRFCLVGALGFVVDCGLTLLLVQRAGMDVLAGRALAFFAAASLTWQLNRHFTFRSSAGWVSIVPYVALALVGAMINLGVYRAWVAIAGGGTGELMLGVALGSLMAMTFNFFTSRRLLHRGARITPRV